MVEKLLLVAIAHTSAGPAPVCLRYCSNKVGPDGASNPKSSTRCQFPLTMLAVELKCESTPELTHVEKKNPFGRISTSRGILRRPSGPNVSADRTPPPKVTMMTLRREASGRGCATSHRGRMRLAIERPANCTNRRLESAAINTP